MPKEWGGPSDFLASGLYSSRNQKAMFRPLLNQDGFVRPFSTMEYEEAADLSLKKEKPSTFESKSTYQPSYGIDETIDLSTKWRAPQSSEKRHGTSSVSTFAVPNTVVEPVEPCASEKPSDLRSWTRHSAYSMHLPPRKMQRIGDSGISGSSSPDVIVLSDEDHPRVNGHLNGYESDSKHDTSDMDTSQMPPLPPQKQWDPSELAEKQRKVRELRNELRSEEMKLVLLKKLHQSQLIKDTLLNSAAAAAAGKMVPTTNRAPNVAPPPLVRTGPTIPPPQNKLLNPQLPHQPPMVNSPMICNQGAHGAPPPLVAQRASSNSGSSVPINMITGMMRPSQSSISGHGSLARTPVTTPPNMVMGYPLQNLQGIPSSQHQIPITQPAPPVCSSPQSSAQPPQIERIDNQTPAQKQAAAKLALRKQLEKTLLQIPPPKPPPPEMHFIPNANNQEFICLLGLEKVVDLITEDPNINRPPPEPFECVQCGTDFSPVWKWQDAGSSRNRKPAVICETCVTSNIKKALKAEHTNRLKTAFVKALQQEQEIEQRMSQALPSPPPATSISPVHTPSSTPTPAIVTSTGPTIPTPPAPHSPVHGLVSKMGSNTSAAAMANSATLLQHLPKLSAAHQSLLHAQAQQLQQFAQTLPQPQPAHMLPFAPLLAAQAYSYQLLGKSHMTSAELQRQYLLDMIPPRSLPQSSMNWKT